MFSHKRYRWNITSMSFHLSFLWDLCCCTFLINARVFRFYRHCPSFTTASLSVSNTPSFGSRFFSSWEERWSGRIAFPFPHLPGFHCYNPGQKSLGQYCNIHIFLLFFGSLFKTVQRFRNFLVVLPPPPDTKLKLGKKFWIHESNIVCRVRGGAGPVWLGKRPRNAKVSQDFCPWLSEKEVGRKKAILRGFQACKSVYSGSWLKIVIEQIFSKLFGVF